MVVLAAAHLRVPTIRLPPPVACRFRRGGRGFAEPPSAQPLRDPLLQILYPPPDVNRRPLRRRAKQMDVVGHDDVPSDKPCFSLAARINKDRMEQIRRQKIPARLDGKCHEQDDRTTMILDRRHMRWPLPLRQFGLIDIHIRLAYIRPDPQSIRTRGSPQARPPTFTLTFSVRRSTFGVCSLARFAPHLFAGLEGEAAPSRFASLTS